MKKITAITIFFLWAVAMHKSIAQQVGIPYIPCMQETVAGTPASININKGSKATQLLRNNLTKRLFEANTELQNFSRNNIGDTLVLDFFAGKQYKALVKQVSGSYDGITGITAQILDTEFGYCFISASGKEVSISAEIPQTDEYFSTKKENGLNYLLEQKLSEVRTDTECSHACNHDHEYGHVNEKNQKTSPALRAVTPTLPDNTSPVTVSVLVVYTPAAKQYAIQNGSDINTMIDNAMLRSNLVLNNSQTNLTLNLVHKQEIDCIEGASPNEDLKKLRNPQDGFADEAHAIRSRYGADLVVLIAGEVYSSNTLGAGYIPSDEWGNPKSAFSVVRVKTISNDYTMIHEIGHNFGCGHHTDTDNNSLYAYAHGYKGTTSQGNRFSTIMSYENTNAINYPRIPYFSNPDILFENTNTGDANANNAKTIRQTKSLISGYSQDLKWTDNFLQDIDISAGTLTPAFNPGIYDYTVNVDNSITSIDIKGIPNSQSSTVNGNITQMPLSIGDNTMIIEIEDGWGSGRKKYTIKIIRSAGYEKMAKHAQTGIGTMQPQATLEVAAMTAQANMADGVMMPCITGDELTAKDKAYGEDQTGAMVYVTSAVSAGSASTKTAGVIAEGYYYFDGVVWQAMKGRNGSVKSSSSISISPAGVASDTSAGTSAYNAGNSLAIDFTHNNLACTAADAGNLFTLTGLKNGGTYALAVKGAVSGTASLSAAGFEIKIMNNQPSVENTHTLYNIVVIDSTAYVYVTTGFKISV